MMELEAGMTNIKTGNRKTMAFRYNINKAQ